MNEMPPIREDPLWERWTIDELFDRRARVLVCRSEPMPSHEAMLAAVRSAAAPTRDVAAIGSELRSAVADAEMRGKQSWSDERPSFMETDSLGRFLKHRSGKPGLPHDRPLREGDVFLVAVNQRDLAQEPLSAAGRPAAGTDEVLAAYESAGVDVFDVTAAARQSAKALHDAAIRATGRGTRNG